MPPSAHSAAMVSRSSSSETAGSHGGWRTALARIPGATVLNRVVLNQVLVRFDDDDAITREVAARLQDEGTAWLAGTTYHGRVGDPDLRLELGHDRRRTETGRSRR